jgi:2-dehydro-3-deoxy-D-arabinonate dehydratase
MSEAGRGLGIFRVRLPNGLDRLARGCAATGPRELLPPDWSIDALLAADDCRRIEDALHVVADGMVPEGTVVLAPVENQEIWAAGVTYLRSRDARVAESSTDGDCYARVYEAERPELFFKAPGWRVRGPGDAICIRADSTWDVPEPELGIVIDATGSTVAYTIGNDASSRSIEGENPLYLPQAKVYTGSCAIGPALVPVSQVDLPFEINVRIERAGDLLYADSTTTNRLHRDPTLLATWLTTALDFPVGAVLLTGTCLVPPDSITLEPRDVTTISINDLGTLVNHVERVGMTPA